MRGLTVALGFLTVFPIRLPAPRPGDLGRAAAWFPAVGLGLGLLLSATFWLMLRVLPPLLAGVLLVALWAAITGGLHLDGLADCGDGLLSAVNRERRLEVMRDPRLGTFGALTLILFLLLKSAAVYALAGTTLWGGWVFMPLTTTPVLLPAGAFVLAPVAARALVLVAARQKAARPEGLGADFAQYMKPSTVLIAAVLPIVVLMFGGARALLAVATASIATWAVLRFAKARLGGVTGDVLGLVVELSELTILVTYLAHAR